MTLLSHGVAPVYRIKYFIMKISVYTDGGSRGNPGPSGFGVAIYGDNHQVLAQISKFIGIKTNNEAEYFALIEALTWVRDHQTDYSAVSFYSDSQLLVRQVVGKYKVKADHIKPLHHQIIGLISEISIPTSFHEILREKNELADSLANQAMDHRHD